MAKEKIIMEMNDNYNKDEVEFYVKPFMYIKGFAAGLELKQTGIALTLARKLHDGQYRKGGLPYIVHPLQVCSTLISYGMKDDVMLAAALLHDVLEDCQDKLQGGEEALAKYRISEDTLEIIRLLTKESGLDDYELSIYFKKIEENPKAAMIKLADRLHNSGTLYTFTLPKMEKYIRETSDFLIPMAGYCKDYYPEYNNAFENLEKNISRLNDTMRVMMEKFKTTEAG